MPGPGGGSRGGGFGGGSRGGGFSGGGGGFGGGGHGHHGHHGHYHHYHHGPRMIFLGGFWPGRCYYGGGGFFHSFFAVLILPIIILVLFMAVLLGSFINSLGNILAGGTVEYDELTMQEYANARYYEYFDSSSEGFEENILITFVIAEETDGYYTIAWVGNDLSRGVRDLYGDETTAFGNAVRSSIGDQYKFSLPQNLHDVIDKMIAPTKTAGGADTTPSDGESRFVNLSDISIAETTVMRAIENFHSETGIPVVLVVEDEKDVFPKSIKGEDILIVVIMLILSVFLIILILRCVKAKKYDPDNPPDGGYQERLRV